MSAAALLAHGGGWDEAAFIAFPIALFGGLLIVANKRAAAAGREGPENPLDHEEQSDSTDSDPDAKPDASPTEEAPR